MRSQRSRCILFTFFTILASFILGVNGLAASRNTSAIDSLNREAQKYYNSSFARARILASAAKEQSLRLGYLKGRIASTCVLSLIAVNTNDVHAACDALLPLLLSSPDLSSKQSLYITLGTCWSYRGDYDSARKYFESGLKLFPSHARTLEYANACLFTSMVYTKKGMNTQALDCYNRAMHIIKDHPDPQTLAWSNNVIGTIYYRQRLYQKAIIALKESFTGFKSGGNRCGMISSLLQLGNTYYMLMLDDSALACYNNSLTEARALGDTMSMAVNYSNLSRVLLEYNRTGDAIASAEKALALIKPGSYVGIEAGTYQQLGDIYGELEKLPQAAQSLQKALATARVSDNKTIIGDCYKSLSELYADSTMKQYKSGYDYLLAAYRIKDSIQSVAFSGQLADMEVKYETEKKEAEIRLLQQLELEQKDKIKRKNLSLLTLGALIAAIAVAVYFYISRRRQAEHFNQQQAVRLAEEAERQRIAKDIHDELGSGLSKITVLSDMLNRQIDDRGRVFTTIHSISDTSRLLIDNMKDMVWNMKPENTTLDNLVARIREYSVDYLDDLPIDLITDIPQDIPPQKIPMEVSRNALMILKESLQNIVKHAQATSVIITVRISPRFRMEIRDNGRGYQPDMKKGGNGIKNIIARSGSIGARLHMYSEPGKGSITTVELDIDATLATT